MEVFHHVADQLKDTPLFESNVMEEEPEQTGALYNDFDQESPFENISTPAIDLTSSQTIAPLVEEAEVDHALLDADRHENIFAPYTVFDTDNFDCATEVPDKEYYEKVTPMKFHYFEISRAAFLFLIIRHYQILGIQYHFRRP